MKKIAAAESDAQRQNTCKTDRGKKTRAVLAKLLFVGAIVAIDSTADPGIANQSIGDEPPMACYLYGPERSPPLP